MAIFIAATAFYLLIGEMAVRLVIHAPILKIRDFRHERAARTINQAVQYDSVLAAQGIDRFIDVPPVPHWAGRIVYVLVALIAAFAIWAEFARIDIVVYMARAE